MDWVNELLKLLFGQVGVLGTVLIGMVYYIGRLLETEQKEHAETRRRAEETNERRIAIFETYLKAMADLKGAVESSANLTKLAIDGLTVAINRRKSGRDVRDADN